MNEPQDLRHELGWTQTDLALAELLLDWENYGRDLPSRLTTGTPRQVLSATAVAKMLHGGHRRSDRSST